MHWIWWRVAALPLLVVAAGLAFVLTGPWDRPGQPQDRPAPAVRLPEGAALRIGVLGTSLSHAPGWPEALAHALAACLDRPVDLQRLTRPGAGVAWGLTQVPAVAAAAPHLLLVEFAINDADLRDGQGRAANLAAHRALIAGVQAADPDLSVVLLTMNPATGLRGLVRARLAAHYRDYRALASEHDTGLADLYPRWRHLPRAAWQMPDGLHPHPDAARAVALPVLAPLLGQALGQDCNLP